MNNNFYNILSKFESILQNMANFAITAKSSQEIDNTPNLLNLPGDVGDIITKDRNLLYYKSVNENDFQSLSAQYPNIALKYESVLSSGINRSATWTKSLHGWKLLGYVTQNADENCCIDNRKLNPIIYWDNPSDIAVNTPLSDVQLNAIAVYNDIRISGEFRYNPPAGTVLPSGRHQLFVNFIPYDLNLYNNADKSVFINVGRITQSDNPDEYYLHWETPQNITYGTPLTDNQLNALATYQNVELDGKYIYEPGYGAYLPIGTHKLDVTFIPTEIEKFTEATGSVMIQVEKGDLSKYISWVFNNTSSITCDGVFDGKILYAQLITPEGFNIDYSVNYYIDGTPIAYDDKISDIPGLTLGTGHYITASFIPSDTENFDIANAYCYVTVVGKELLIEWNSVNEIPYNDIFSSANIDNLIVKYKDNDEIVNGTCVYYYDNNGTKTQITLNSTHCLSDIGTTNIYCEFTPGNNDICADSFSLTSSIEVKKSGNYTINWNPSSLLLVCGEELSANRLNATTSPSIPGYFKYYDKNKVNTFNTDSKFNVAGSYIIYPQFNCTNGKYQNLFGASKTFIVYKNRNYTIDWNPNTIIYYGDTVDLNATTSPVIAGVFKYYTGGTLVNENTILTIGTHEVTASFIPNDSNYYGEQSTVKSITVQQSSNYNLNWNTDNYDFISFDKRIINIDLWKNDVYYSSNIRGTVAFSENGSTLTGTTTLSVGSHTIVCTLTPENQGYSPKSITKTIVVSEFSFLNNNRNLTITGYRDDITVATISLDDNYTVNGNLYKVVAIGDSAFNTNLNTVETFTVNESGHYIKSIGNLAFGGLVNLTSLVNYNNQSDTVFNYVENIGVNPFINCIHLTPVNINNNKFITIDNVLYEKLSDNEYASICYYASSTNNYYVLDSKIRQIGKYTFTNNEYDCNITKLQVLVIPNDVNDIIIHSDAFNSNSNLKTIYFPGEKYVELTDTYINGLDFSNLNTFLYFKKLDNLNFGNYLKNYYNLNNNRFRFVGDELNYTYAPARLSEGTYIQNLTASFSNSSSNLNASYTGITSITVPYGYQIISGSALGNCTLLTTINIPKSLTGIDEQYGLCFGCPKLSTINLYPKVESTQYTCNYKVFNESSIQKQPNILFELHYVDGYPKYKLICYPINRSPNPSYTIYAAGPNARNDDIEIDEIGNYAFYTVTQLININIGGESNILLNKIGDRAFYGVNCTFDGDDVFISPANLTYLGKRAFEQNYAGTNEIIINDKLLNYGGYASKGFINYSDFNMLHNPFAATDTIDTNESVTCETDPQSISIETDDPNQTITGYTGYKYNKEDTCIYLYEDSSDNDLYDNANADSKKTLVSKFLVKNAEDEVYTLSSSINFIANFACYGMHNITMYDLSQGSNPHLTTIGQYSLANCRNLNKIKLPTTLNRITDGAFSGNGSLKYINLEDCNITTVGQAAFYRDKSLKTITFNFPESESISVSHLVLGYCTDMRVIMLTGSFPLANPLTNSSKCGFSDDSFANINNTLRGYIYYPHSWEDMIDDDITAYTSFKTTLSSASNFTAQTYIENNNIYYVLNPDNFTAEVCGCKNTNGTISIDNTLTHDNITYSVIKIRDYSFVNKEMSAVSIPQGVVEIGKYFVSGCDNLSTFIVNTSNTKFTTENSGKLLIGIDVVNNTNSRVLYSYAPNDVATEFTASTFQEIRESAFDNCNNLTGIYIGNSIRKIEPRAFYQCKNLEKIVTDETNQYYVATNNTVEGNTNSSDNGILYEIPSGHGVDSTALIANLLYVPQALNIKYLRIPSQLAITPVGSSITSYFNLNEIKTGAIENTRLGIIIFPKLSTTDNLIKLNSECIAYNDDLNSIIFDSYVQSNSDSIILLKNQFNSPVYRHTVIYSVDSLVSNISGYQTQNIQKSNYIITENNVEIYNANYYIDGNFKLIACTAEPTYSNGIEILNIYNNFTANGQNRYFSEIDTYSLSNRGSGIGTPMSLFFINVNSDTGFTNINKIDSHIFYGSYGVTNIYFYQTAPEVGAHNMFNRGNEDADTQKSLIVPLENESNWIDFIGRYNITDVNIIPQ